MQSKIPIAVKIVLQEVRCHCVKMAFTLWLFIVILQSVIASLDNEYQKYTFYFETYQYSLNPSNNTNNNNNSTTFIHINHDNETIYSDATTFDIQLNDEISINILKSSGMPYIMNIIDRSNDSEQISLQYDDEDEFNSIDIWYTPDRQRRRLRRCRRRHWWHWDHYYCPPIPPPHWCL